MTPRDGGAGFRCWWTGRPGWLVGGGATLVAYTGDLGFALSGGADAPTTGGATLPCIGGFVGFRGDHETRSDRQPFGVRFDARLGPDAQRSYTVAARIDVLGLVLGAAAFTSLVLHPPR
jgi:hypothetical protein